jgi:hypothetical protein
MRIRVEQPADQAAAQNHQDETPRPADASTPLTPAGDRITVANWKH